MKTLSPLKIAFFVLAIGVPFTGMAALERGEPEPPAHHDKEMRRHGGMHGMLRELDLSATQKTEIKQLFTQLKQDRSESRPSKDQRTAHKAEMLALISAPQFDEARARQLLGEKQQAHEARAIAHLQLQQQIYQLLTPEQQAKFEQLFARRGAKPPKD